MMDWDLSQYRTHYSLILNMNISFTIPTCLFPSSSHLLTPPLLSPLTIPHPLAILTPPPLYGLFPSYFLYLFLLSVCNHLISLTHLSYLFLFQYGCISCRQFSGSFINSSIFILPSSVSFVFFNKSSINIRSISSNWNKEWIEGWSEYSFFPPFILYHTHSISFYLRSLHLFPTALIITQITPIQEG